MPVGILTVEAAAPAESYDMLAWGLLQEKFFLYCIANSSSIFRHACMM
jgi:hypothetical protein